MSAQLRRNVATAIASPSRVPGPDLTKWARPVTGVWEDVADTCLNPVLASANQRVDPDERARDVSLHALTVELEDWTDAPPTPDLMTLWCHQGRHEWTRPKQRGRPPKACPEHAHR